MSDSKLIDEIEKFQGEARKYNTMKGHAEDKASEALKDLYEQRGWKKYALVKDATGDVCMIVKVLTPPYANPRSAEGPNFTYLRLKKDGSPGVREFRAYNSQTFTLTGDFHTEGSKQ